MTNILDRVFGNKVIFVEGYKLYGYARWEQTFIFHKSACADEILNTLKSKNYSIISKKIKRTKKHLSPQKNKHRPITFEKVVCYYD